MTVVTDATTEATGARTAAMTEVTAATTAATVVPDLGCSASRRLLVEQAPSFELESGLQPRACHPAARPGRHGGA